jgi:hypothetical protein
MLLDIPDTLQISTHVLTGRVVGLSRKSNMDLCSNPTGSSVNHVAIDLTLFLCACYNADMFPTYPYATCRLNIVSTSADTVFGHVANMLADMSATCRANTHVSVDSTIFLTFENPTFPAKELEECHFGGEENRHFLHTSVCRNKFFLLELRTNCIVLYGTTFKIIFWGKSGTELYHTG